MTSYAFSASDIWVFYILLLYRMYIKADKKQRGYQKRLKTLWNKDYPREAHVNEKQLAQQIRNIE